MNKLILLFLPFLFSHTYSQSNLAAIATKLDSLAGDHQHRSGFMMDPWDDFNNELYDSLVFELENGLQQLSSSRLFEIAEIFDSTYIHVFVSSDAQLKIFNWEYINGGSMEEQHGFILLRCADSVLQFDTEFMVEHAYVLASSTQRYLIKGYFQGCSTCFQEFAVIMDCTGITQRLQTVYYRHSYFPYGVLTYEPSTQTLSLDLEEVYIDKEMHGPDEQVEASSGIYRYNNRSGQFEQTENN